MVTANTQTDIIVEPMRKNNREWLWRFTCYVCPFGMELDWYHVIKRDAERHNEYKHKGTMNIVVF